ncbi:MAG: glycolate oxidase subunit GlcF [Betaproteobacteria bacterium]|nr:glycolate oxidase subunit GlcF [Betaproteobacteria bacterium]
MQTELAPWIRDTPEGIEANAILRKCVHCGFCNATCPTYQLLGDELDGPRGRIYLIKQVLEGVVPTEKTQSHLDRCLTCRACETTCPSGVGYGRLADIGRGLVEARVSRSLWASIKRGALAMVLPRAWLFAPLVALGRLVKPMLPKALAAKVPATPAPAGIWPAARHVRRMLVLAGCVQPALAPRINAATARVLDRAGISLLQMPRTGCCGALRYHLNRQSDGLDDMRALIDVWWPLIEGGVEAIVMTASGCGVTVKEYGHLLRNDAAYATKAARVSALCRDIAEIVAAEWEGSKLLDALSLTPAEKIAFHPPCSLQHGQNIRGAVEAILRAVGADLTPVQDEHLCCGSAGTYSILQPDLSQKLRANKLAALASGGPRRILSANIGCLSHLAEFSAVPVEHWIEYLDRRLF